MDILLCFSFFKQAPHEIDNVKFGLAISLKFSQKDSGVGLFNDSHFYGSKGKISFSETQGKIKKNSSFHND